MNLLLPLVFSNSAILGTYSALSSNYFLRLLGVTLKAPCKNRNYGKEQHIWLTLSSFSVVPSFVDR